MYFIGMATLVASDVALAYLCGKATNGATKVALPITVLSSY
ncbi:hypothetical protein SPONN_2145 [uncultured Candidatus Thioglobus sp.]|nr:hypothetical protein SPONN_2145 [uncultured Candidatus Thioglobus sp.]